MPQVYWIASIECENAPHTEWNSGKIVHNNYISGTRYTKIKFDKKFSSLRDIRNRKQKTAKANHKRTQTNERASRGMLKPEEVDTWCAYMFLNIWAKWQVSFCFVLFARPNVSQTNPWNSTLETWRPKIGSVRLPYSICYIRFDAVVNSFQRVHGVRMLLAVRSQLMAASSIP